LEVNVAHHGGRPVVAVEGEIDLATAGRLRDHVHELTAGADRVIVDLEGVEFIDSTGIGVLVGGMKRARNHGGDLSLVCTRGRILKVLEITGLSTVFAVHRSLADALDT
jgi:anti-sigma B factor antagonist